MQSRLKDPVSGLSHLAGLGLALAGVAWLVACGGEDAGMNAGICVYGASLIALYAASSAYHLVVADERATRTLRALDHMAIFLLVAGTCTPIFWRAFEGAARTAMLGAIWGMAIVGIALRAAWGRAPRAVSTTLYVAMGWMILVRWAEVRRAIPGAALALVVAGGVTYTLGAIVYVLKRPNPFPRVFGFHEIWHLFVLGGSAMHFAAVAALQ
jgi:hemolysin III